MNWPIETFLDLLFKIDDLEVFQNMCKTNKTMHRLCKKYRVAFCKHFLQKFSVDYNDPENFIYVANGVQKDDYFSESGEPNLCKLMLLYVICNF